MQLSISDQMLKTGDIEMISIVDDDGSVREALVSLVRSLGYEAFGFASADAFLSAEDFDRFSCAITDVHMPGMNGFELKKQLAARGRTLPVIMITAGSGSDLEARARSLGSIAFLRKPFRSDTLAACIEQALSSRENCSGTPR
jgi:FixJ family two-component response regulator